MVTIKARAYDLPLKHAFTISRSTKTVQKTLIVEAFSEGMYGYGEATVNEYYGSTITQMASAIEAVSSRIAELSPDEPDGLLDELKYDLAYSEKDSASFALCALDESLYDLWGKLSGARLCDAWDIDRSASCSSSLTIGIDTIPNMVCKLQEEPEWPIYKIKLGTLGDIAIVRELRKHTNAIFRIDANCAWTADQTIEHSFELERLGVEFIEQPLPPDDEAGMQRIMRESALAVIADESCVTEEDVDRCHGLFHGVNIKLMKCGGLAPARRMIDRARELNMRVMIGCMTESTVGISAAAQLLPLADYADIDGASLLANDIATGSRLDKGRCVFSSRHGTGAKLINGPLMR